MDDKQKCMIIGAVPVRNKDIFHDFDPVQYFVICADAGYEIALENGIRPDLIVGDFDSASEPPPEELDCLTLPVKKDVTDTMYAAMRGVQMGFKEFVLVGCLGGRRFDHSLANLEVMYYITKRSCTAILAGDTDRGIMLQNKKMRITKSVGDIVSVFPYGDHSCTVSYSGLDYPLYRKTLAVGSTPMGVSNQVVEDPAEITVHSGTALVMLHRP